MADEIIGWDIGGAHLKAAVLDQNRVIVKVLQHPCPLWKGLEVLHEAFAELLKQLPAAPRLHALTMTGELVDLFPGREHGVKAIIATAEQVLDGDRLRIFAADRGFIKPAELHAGYIDAIASANWYASAAYAASKISAGLFIDIGSTTTDILLLENSAVQAVGMTDFQRLDSEELVYTGIVRTPVMAVARHALFNGRRIGLMAEYFATMADVYRLTGELDEAHDQTPSADGAAKTVADSARRLARMIGCDFYEHELQYWIGFARNLRTRQMQSIQNACERHLSRSSATSITLVGAGVGRFLAEHIARQLDCPYQDFGAFFPAPTQQSPMSCADCAPAVAVAVLAGDSDL